MAEHSRESGGYLFENLKRACPKIDRFGVMLLTSKNPLNFPTAGALPKQAAPLLHTNLLISPSLLSPGVVGKYYNRVGRGHGIAECGGALSCAYFQAAGKDKEEMSGDVDMKLTPKQEAFVDYYIETGNATEAARRAGYSRGIANRIGTENLSKPVIQQAIKARQAEIKSERTADITETMEFLTAVMRGEVMEQVVVVEGVGDGCSKARLVEKTPSVADRTKAADHILKRYGRPPKLEEEELHLKIDKLRSEVKTLAMTQDDKEGLSNDVIIMLPEKEDAERSQEE